MSESELRTAGRVSRAVDLEALERGMRADQGADLTEAKEAFVDALLGLTVRRRLLPLVPAPPVVVAGPAGIG